MGKRENSPDQERYSPVCYSENPELREEFKYGDSFEAPEKKVRKPIKEKVRSRFSKSTASRLNWD